jgi:hypothetical protein
MGGRTTYRPFLLFALVGDLFDWQTHEIHPSQNRTYVLIFTYAWFLFACRILLFNLARVPGMLADPRACLSKWALRLSVGFARPVAVLQVQATPSPGRSHSFFLSFFKKRILLRSPGLLFPCRKPAP